MGGVSTGELLVVLVIVLVLFGQGRIANSARELGTAIREFRRGLQDEPVREKTPQDKTE